jgi:hypothetical protein
MGWRWRVTSIDSYVWQLMMMEDMTNSTLPQMLPNIVREYFLTGSPKSSSHVKFQGEALLFLVVAPNGGFTVIILVPLLLLEEKASSLRPNTVNLVLLAGDD